MQAFVAMPFNPDFLPVWKRIKAACKTNGIDAVRVDQLPHVDDIHGTIFKEIERSDILIVDFTGDQVSTVPNPNVVTEAKHGKDRQVPIVILTQSLEALPFDWRTHRAVIYQADDKGLAYLEEILTENLEGICRRINRGEKPSSPPKNSTSSPKASTSWSSKNSSYSSSSSSEKNTTSSAVAKSSFPSDCEVVVHHPAAGRHSISLATIFSTQDWRLTVNGQRLVISIFLWYAKVEFGGQQMYGKFHTYGFDVHFNREENGEVVHYAVNVDWRWHWLCRYCEVRRDGEVIYSDK